MRINTNMAALNAWRNMSVNSGNVQKSLEKLSSGFRINRAADDAAGLAVSEKMRAQIRGTQMATRNAQDGISLVQTAEGALTETHSILQRMRELGVQASTSTLSAEDAAQVQTEFTQLRDEVDRIANNTTFNTKKLLNGEANIVTSTSGTGKVANVYGTGDTKMGTLSLTGTGVTAATSATGTMKLKNTLTAAATISVNGKDFTFAAGKTMDDIVKELNNASAQTGVTINSKADLPTIATAGTVTTPYADSATWNPTNPSTLGGAPSTNLADGSYRIVAKVVGSGATSHSYALQKSDGAGGWTAVANSGTAPGADEAASALALGNTGLTFTTEVPGTPAQDGTVVGTFAVSGSTAAPATSTLTYSSTAVGTGSKFTLSGTGSDVSNVVAPSNDGADATIAAGEFLAPGQTAGGGTAINVTAGSEDYTAKGNTITFTKGDAKGMTFTVAQTGKVDINVEKNGSMGVQIGSEEGQQMKISIGSMTAKSLGLDTQNLTDQGKAGNAITALDGAINRVSTQRAQLGAVQNRLEHTVASLQVTAENLQGAESRIRDVDMASEMANFTKNNILQQASQAMLAQANQSTQGVLSLLR